MLNKILSGKIGNEGEDSLMKTISIIIPVYKVEDFIHTCVDSVINQTYREIEIILVDDGSPDQCPDICDNYVKKDDRVKVIHQKNAGLSAARNTGLQYATGNYILFLDSDDYLALDYCEKVMLAAESTGSDIVIGEIATVDEQGNIIHDKREQFYQEQKVYDNKQAMQLAITEVEFKGYAWGKLYTKEVAENIEYPVGRVYEDRYTVPKYFSRAKRVCLYPGAVAYYRMRDTSISHETDPKKLYDLLDAEKWLVEYCKEYYPELVGKMESVYFGRHLHIWTIIYNSGNAEQIEKFVCKMKKLYEEYAKKSELRKLHKLSYKIIFTAPKLFMMGYKLFKSVKKK